MFCKNCGAEIDDKAVVCPKCGVAQTASGKVAAPDDAPNIGFSVLCAFIPILGLILYLLWHETYPLKAKSCCKGAIIGFIISVVLGVLSGIIYACTVATLL